MIVNIIWYCFFKRKYGRRKELRGWSWSSNFNCEACVDVDNRWPAVSLLAATWHYPLNWCLSQVPSSDTREPNSEGKQRFWNCKKCKAVTTTRFGTVLYKSKMKLKNWILLAFCFTERNKSYAHTSNEASLPQEGYEDRTLSGTTINRWYRFFRKLCRNDFQRQGGRICVKAQRALSEKFRLGQKF